MSIAYMQAPGRGETDRLLQDVARDLAARGLALAGTVQINSECRDEGPCDMDVRVLPAGPVIRISQSLGAQARGCRLDPGALERAVAAVEAGLDGADLLIVNKFGKHEAAGRGFRPVIAEAMARGIPVLVGLNGLNAAAFAAFADGLAVEVAPGRAALLDWAVAAVAARAGGETLGA
jgi:hypothetical protein